MVTFFKNSLSIRYAYQIKSNVSLNCVFSDDLPYRNINCNIGRNV